MIKKSFRPNRKYMIWAMITAFIATLIFIAFGVILESYRNNQLDQSIDLYGSYHFCFHGLTDEQIDYVNHHDAVEQTALVRNIETIGKDYVCNCMCVNESLFDISEYRMVEGRFLGRNLTDSTCEDRQKSLIRCQLRVEMCVFL